MKGRIALVTGGIGDIGTAICRELSQQGATVVAVDRQAQATAWQAEQLQQGYSIHYQPVDVVDFDSCCRMAQRVVAEVGPVDILVNAAGTIQDATLRKMTPEQWRDVVHTDLDSMFNVTKQFIESMIEREFGRIISIASVNAEKGQFGQTNYAAAKAGVYGFTKSLAQELAKFGVTVNAISPGFVESRMVQSIPDSVLEKIIARIPVGRLALPDEMAWVIGFLASERSGYITGTNLSVNGGLHM